MNSQALARQVIHALRAHGHQAWLVGGCVRDRLLGVPPKDHDVVTDARPDRVAELFPKSEHIGAHFGVVMVYNEFTEVEVATFRSDGDYSDGRRPDSVVFESDPRRDVERRDFTINALLENPDTGEILDFIGGRADLQAKLIRAVGDPDRRFEEDHLRLLRAIRFAARFGFSIEPATWDAICRRHPLAATIAAERVRGELIRILTEGGARRGFELLDSSGMLRVLLPEVAAMKGVQQPPQFHPEGDVWLHTLLLLENLDHPTPTLALGALLHDVGKPPTFRVADRIRFDGHVEAGVDLARRILLRLHFSNEQIEQVSALVANHMKFSAVHQMRESTLKRFLRQPEFREHLELHRLDCLASYGGLANHEFVRQRLTLFNQEQLKPSPLLTGNDLIRAGYRPGPLFTRILSAVEDAQLEGELPDSQAALKFVRERFTPPHE